MDDGIGRACNCMVLMVAWWHVIMWRTCNCMTLTVVRWNMMVWGEYAIVGSNGGAVEYDGVGRVRDCRF
jgi:hypothetical protein